MFFLLIVENEDKSSLQYTYYRELSNLGKKVELLNFSDYRSNNIFFKYFPKRVFNYIINHFWVKTDIQKSNIKFVKEIFKIKPDFIFFFTNPQVNPSTILYLKSIGVKCILIYPDAFVNMPILNSSSVKFYDYIFTHSKTSINSFNLLGNFKTYWQPLGGELKLHYQKPRQKYLYDISFIGNFRPEREIVINYIIQKFPNLNIKISGDWRMTKSKEIRKRCQNVQLTGKDYSDFINSSFINLNIIDYTNYPAANMRFFEIPLAGGLQVSSYCPEMADLFIDEKHLLYFEDLIDLKKKIEFALNNEEIVNTIKLESQKLILNDHLYSNRIKEIINIILPNIE